jgi:hypothetical protein
LNKLKPIKKENKMKKRYLLYALILIFSLSSCSVIKQMTNISRLKFKLNGVSNFTLSGINLSNKSSLRDFGPFDSAQLLNNFAKGSLPVSFVLNIEAYNPNDGGGYPRN